MIIKWYEIVCNHCGNAEHFQGSAQNAEEQFKFTGGIVLKNKVHYCNKGCLKKDKNVKNK